MTVNELIERLQEIADDGLSECEVRLAFQPKWPLQFTLGGIATPDDAGLDDVDDRAPDEAPETPAVYLVEGTPIHESPYAPGWVFAAAR